MLKIPRMILIEIVAVPNGFLANGTPRKEEFVEVTFLPCMSAQES